MNIIMRICTGLISLSLWVLVPTGGVSAQPLENDLSVLASWVALDAPTGHEHLATQRLVAQLDNWSIDRHGNMLKTVGDGDFHRVVACSLDARAFAVTQITEDGYLRLHMIGRVPAHPLWPQMHQGQQLRVLTRSGPVIGVTAATNGHFINLHQDEAIASPDDLWLDVGARSAADVADMGIALLDPVLRHLPAWSYGDEVAGPSAGARAGCAVLAELAEAETSPDGKTTWIMATQSAFGHIGLSSAIADLRQVDQLIMLGQGQGEPVNMPIKGVSSRIDAVLRHAGVANIQLLSPKVSAPGALMERIQSGAVDQLRDALAALIGANGVNVRQVSAPAQAAAMNAQPGRLGGGPALAEIEALLDQLAETPAVFGHEGPVRAIVRQALPEWAAAIAQTDELGNLWVDVGPKTSKATVFMAHMDEVGFEVQSIGTDGVVQLKRLGGATSFAWEGQPARLQLDVGRDSQSAGAVAELNGVFLARDMPDRKRPEAIEAWFGMDGADLVSAGVQVGMGVTGYKEGHRMGRYRYTARGLDDRVGTTALLLALRGINPDQLQHRVIFAWSVQEEGGLFGAGALAERFGLETQRIYSIDTFVSSDTPLESAHFAHAPLGQGPVLRSIENSGMVRPDELDRNRRIAADAGIDVQIGLTQGGTDGTAFSFWGAPNAGLSWPGRYSHGPAEVADLRDVAELIKLVRAMAVADPN